MHLFLAIDLSEIAKKSINKQLSELQLLYPQFSWISPASYHITIHSFKETQKLNEIKPRVEELLYDIPSCQMFSRSLEMIMHDRLTFFVEFHREKNVELIGNTIKDAFIKMNQEKFAPTMEVARYKIPSKQQYLSLKRILGHMSIDADFVVESLSLYENLLGGKQPVYNKVAEFKLLEKGE